MDLNKAIEAFNTDGRVHFNQSDEKAMKVANELISYLEKEDIAYGETNVTPEQLTIYDESKWKGGTKKIQERRLNREFIKEGRLISFTESLSKDYPSGWRDSGNSWMKRLDITDKREINKTLKKYGFSNKKVKPVFKEVQDQSIDDDIKQIIKSIIPEAEVDVYSWLEVSRDRQKFGVSIETGQNKDLKQEISDKFNEITKALKGHKLKPSVGKIQESGSKFSFSMSFKASNLTLIGFEIAEEAFVEDIKEKYKNTDFEYDGYSIGMGFASYAFTHVVSEDPDIRYMVEIKNGEGAYEVELVLIENKKPKKKKTIVKGSGFISDDGVIETKEEFERSLGVK